MAWLYADWRRQATDAAKLDRLALHIEEVENKMKGLQSASGGGMAASYDVGGLARLEAEYQRLEERVRRFTGKTPLSHSHTQR